MTSLSEHDREDMQGLLARGFGQLPVSAFCLFSVVTPLRARAYLMDIITSLLAANQRPQETALQLAMTAKGLDALGLPKKILALFSDPFRSGIDTPHKRRILGDTGASAPEAWDWGGPKSEPVHIMLLCYASTTVNLSNLVKQQISAAEGSGLSLIKRLSGQTLQDNREHFGFKDGLAQPYIAEFDSRKEGNDRRAVPLGEFVLGYPNGYDQFTQRPLIAPEADNDQLLPEDLAGSGLRDLGRNGSYLVYRQLEQDVVSFWRFLFQQAPKLAMTPAGQDADSDLQAVCLAAKMVGRWPNGAPLVKAPMLQDAQAFAKFTTETLDDFLYHHEDQLGHKCPLGAHIRRANPRDSLDPEPGSEQSLAFSDRHRLLRRGRPYGDPICDPLDPKTILQRLVAAEAPADNTQVSRLEDESVVGRGLHFMCLGANIQRQFEFVQYTWCTNPNFNGLYNDPDPIMGDRAVHGQKHDNFTLQDPFIRRQVRGLPEFIKTRGGAYFFMPGKRALRYMLMQCE
jgi:Dyp-type peroxidase family